jgi:hypothetical protein
MTEVQNGFPRLYGIESEPRQLCTVASESSYVILAVDIIVNCYISEK